MTEIKKKIMLKNQKFDLEDGYSVFAFVKNNDTLYADNSLEFWRYNHRGMRIILSKDLKNKILENYSLQIK